MSEPLSVVQFFTSFRLEFCCGCQQAGGVIVVVSSCKNGFLCALASYFHIVPDTVVNDAIGLAGDRSFFNEISVSVRDTE